MLKQKIEHMVASGKVEKALKHLMTAVSGKDGSIYNKLILLSARLNTNTRSNHAGILSTEDFNLEQNKLINAVLAQLSEIEEEGYLKGVSLEDLSDKSDSGKGKSNATKILYLGSQPKDTEDLFLEKEYIGIRKIFKDKRKEFDLLEQFDTTLDTLFKAIDEEKPEIIQISAHAGTNYLYLQWDDQSENEIPYEYLAAPFQLFGEYANCLFLNTITSGTFLKQVSRSTTYAIGFDSYISEKDTISFSSGFYTGIAADKSIEDSFDLAIQVLDASRDEETDEEYSVLLFKNGNCLNRKDDFPESFKDVEYEEDEDNE